MPNTSIITTSSGRTLEQVKIGLRIRMENLALNAIEIGKDLTEAKEACEHGEWLPFLKELGFSPSTAANYMRIAREVEPGSDLAKLPYTKILAVIVAPPDEREELVALAKEMSAAEIRKLTDERNKASEAANIESARANDAEERVESLQKTIEMRDQQIVENQKLIYSKQEEAHYLKVDLEQTRERENELRARLLEAENNRVEVEVAPADYQMIKDDLETARRTVKELMDAAEEAEARANAAEEELEEARAGKGQEETSECGKMEMAMRSFLLQCEGMPYRPERLMRDADRIRNDVSRIQRWCEAMLQAISVQPVEGVVV